MEACLPFPAERLQLLFDGGFYNDALKRQSPYLYRLCGLYLRELAPLSEKAREKKYGELLKGYFSEHPGALSRMLRYYEYCLCQYYFNVYQDYSFTLWMIRGLIDLNLILLFCVLRWKELGKERLDLRETAHIISVCERRARHNHGIFERLSRITQEFVFNR